MLELGPGEAQGTALYGETALAEARFVAVYHENTLLALTHVEARGSAFDDRYAGFYLDTVAAHPGRWDDPNHWAAPGWPSGAERTATVPAPLWGDRAITLPEGVNATVGEIVFTNGEHRNRIDGSGSLNFNGAQARITVTDAGAGWAEFDLGGPVSLSSGLTLDIQSVEADPFGPEFGALRLRGLWQGPGDLVKTGPGVASLTGGDKNFTGELRVEEGVLRITAPATPGQVASARVLSGGQLRLVSTGESRLYDLGVPLQLAGSGRDPAAVPEGDQRGILGSLRFDPFANDNGADLTRGVILSGDDPVSIHIDGTRNLLDVGGTVAGNTAFHKTGGGTLRLSGSSTTLFTSTVVNGTLRVDGDYDQLSVSLEPDGVLSGTGTLKNASGAGTVVLGPGEILSAESVSGLSYRFHLQSGSPPPLLRLQNDPPFDGGFNAANQFAVYLDVPPSAHPRFGFFSEASADLAAPTQSGAWSVYLRDEGENETYTLLTDEPNLFTSRHDGGTILGAGIGPTSYADWAAANDLPEGEDGPADNPFGTGPNLLNFALGLPAGIPPGLEDIQLGVTETGRLFARFRRAPALTGVVHVVEVTPDITDWSAPEILYDSDTDTLPTDFDQILVVDDQPQGATRFLRLKLHLK